MILRICSGQDRFLVIPTAKSSIDLLFLTAYTLNSSQKFSPELAPIIAKSFRFIIYQHLNSPRILEVNNIHSIPKKSFMFPNLSRPIVIASILVKAFEIIIYKYVLSVLDNHNILIDKKYVFHIHQSIADLLIYLKNHVYLTLICLIKF